MRPFFSRFTRRLRVYDPFKSRFHTATNQNYTKEAVSSKKETQTQLLQIANMEQKPDYSSWSHESLIERVTQLELELKNKNERLLFAS